MAGSTNIPSISSASADLRFVAYAGMVVIFLIEARWALSHSSVPLFLTISLVGVALSSTLWSAMPSLTLQRAVGFVLLITMCMTLRRIVVDRTQARRILSVVTIAVVFVLALGLLATFFGYGRGYESTPEAGYARFQGLLVSVNTVGVVVALFAGLVLGLRATAVTAVERAFWNVSFGMMLVSLLLSQSRGGTVALVAALIAYIWTGPSHTRSKVIAIAIAAVLAAGSLFIIAPQLQPQSVELLGDRFEARQTGSPAGSGRLAAWALAVDIWQERPITGWGFGTADVVFGSREQEIEQVFQGNNPHNGFFNTLIETGPTGVALITLILISAWWILTRGTMDPVRRGVFSSVVAATSVSFFESGITSPGSILGFTFWWMLAVGTLLTTVTRLEPSEPLG